MFLQIEKDMCCFIRPIWIHLARFLSLRCSDLHFPGLETTYRHYGVLRIFLPVSDLILTCLTCV